MDKELNAIMFAVNEKALKAMIKNAEVPPGGRLRSAEQAASPCCNDRPAARQEAEHLEGDRAPALIRVV